MLIEENMENIEKQTRKNHLLSHYSTIIIVYYMLENTTHLFFCVFAYCKKQNFQDLTLSLTIEHGYFLESLIIW